jgi:hypothetical protein
MVQPVDPSFVDVRMEAHEAFIERGMVMRAV